MKINPYSLLAVMTALSAMLCNLSSELGGESVRTDKCVACLFPTHPPCSNADGIACMFPTHPPRSNTDGIACMFPTHPPRSNTDGIACMFPTHPPRSNADGIAC